MTDAPPTTGPIRRTPTQKIAAGLVAATLFGALPAIFLSKHIPTETGVRTTEFVAILLAAMTAWESRDGGAFDPARTGTTHWLSKHHLARIPALSLFVFFIASVAVGDGALAVATEALGEPGRRELTVTGVSYSAKRCDHFNVREVRWLLNHALCASREDFQRAKPGDRLIVYGRASPFGLNVERYELRPAGRSAYDRRW